MTHPIELGRRVALHTDSQWRPLKDLVSVICDAFGLRAEDAGRIIGTGILSGSIAHRAVGSKGWISSPRAVELARRGGFSYEDQIDWNSGSVKFGDQSMPIEVYWPDVERVARGGKTAVIIDGEVDRPAQGLIAAPRGRPGSKGDLTQKATAAMLADLRSGAATPESLSNMKQLALAHQYGLTARSAAVKARDAALSQFDASDQS